jgi:GNAT superfamily N-acetyltransferase
METFTIRPATENDLTAIQDLVLQLAIYEKAAHEVTVTLPELQQNFKDGIFQAQVAEKNGQIVGLVLYYLAYSTWKGKMMYLEDFVVAEAHRRQGIGNALFEAVIVAAKQQGCKLMKWQVLDWNAPAIAFYKTYNAAIEQEWFNGKLFF